MIAGDAWAARFVPLIPRAVPVSRSAFWRPLSAAGQILFTPALLRIAWDGWYGDARWGLRSMDLLAPVEHSAGRSIVQFDY
ncbi:hypothetical protein [Nocardia colli]|uniref:hypothetical protein n=1 Tax=Nocardia colli TaxID=2545717 RepID=UPI0035DE405B